MEYYVSEIPLFLFLPSHRRAKGGGGVYKILTANTYGAPYRVLERW